MSKLFELAFPKDHPYHFWLGGNVNDLLKNTTQNKLKSFHKKFYHPNNATLFVVGDIDFEQTIKTVKNSFESIPATNNVSLQKRVPMLCTDLNYKKQTIYEPVKKKMIAIFWKIPGTIDKNSNCNSVIKSILSGNGNLSLHKKLVEETSIATRVFVQSKRYMFGGIFAIFIEPKKNKEDECIKIVKNKFEEIINNGISNREIKVTKLHKQRSLLESMQNLPIFTKKWLKTFMSTGNIHALFTRYDFEFNKIQTNIQKFVKEYLSDLTANYCLIRPLTGKQLQKFRALKEQEKNIKTNLLKKRHRSIPLEKPQYAFLTPPQNPYNLTFPKPNKVVELTNRTKVILVNNSQIPLTSISISSFNAYKDRFTKNKYVHTILFNLLFDSYRTLNFLDDYGVAVNIKPDGVFFSMANENTQQIVEFIFKTFFNEKLNINEFSLAKDSIIEKINRKKTNDKLLIQQQIKKAIYKKEPYGFMHNDLISFLKNVKTEDIDKLYKTLLVPNNLLITCVGSFDINSIEELFKKIDVEILKPFIAENDNIKQKPNIFANANYKKKYVKQDIIIKKSHDFSRISFFCNSDISSPSKEFVMANILNFVVFHSWSSRFFQIREETGLFYSRFGKFAKHSKYLKGYDFFGAVVPKEKLLIAKKLMLNMLKNLNKYGISTQELDASKKLYTENLSNLMGSNISISKILAFSHFKTGKLNFYDLVMKNIQMLSKKDINAFIKKHINSNNMSSLIITSE